MFLKLFLTSLTIAIASISFVKSEKIQHKSRSLANYIHQQNKVIDYSITSEKIVTEMIEDISQDHMNSIIIKLSSFPTRYYLTQSGVDAFYWIYDHWKSLIMTRQDISIELFKHKKHNQPSIILSISGSDPALKDEIIVTGAHGDSINTNSNNIDALAPGADDNAGGVAVVSELIRKIVTTNYKPKRSLHFIIYAAEEPQDRSSYELTRWYRENNKNVLGVINFDGVNYKVGDYDMVLIEDSTDKSQNLFVASLIDKYLGIKWTWQSCNYACSDHHSWTYEGYRASFPFESLLAIENPYIHTEEDTFDKSGNNTEHATLFVKLGLAYLIELDK